MPLIPSYFPKETDPRSPVSAPAWLSKNWKPQSSFLVNLLFRSFLFIFFPKKKTLQSPKKLLSPARLSLPFTVAPARRSAWSPSPLLYSSYSPPLFLSLTPSLYQGPNHSNSPIPPAERHPLIILSVHCSQAKSSVNPNSRRQHLQNSRIPRHKSFVPQNQASLAVRFYFSLLWNPSPKKFMQSWAVFNLCPLSRVQGGRSSKILLPKFKY